MVLKRICRYLQSKKYNGMVFNPSKKLVVDFHVDADSAGLWGHGNPQDPICARSRTVFVVTFPIFLYFGYQNYWQRLIFLHYIISMWHCLVLLEHYFPWKFTSRKWLKNWEFMVRSWSLCQDSLYIRTIMGTYLLKKSKD